MISAHDDAREAREARRAWTDPRDVVVARGKEASFSSKSRRDVVDDFGGIKLAVDRMSVPYLTGASIDFVDTIEKQGFTIDNPNATGSCACGDSFN